jgi:hypothetical protein
LLWHCDLPFLTDLGRGQIFEDCLSIRHLETPVGISYHG